LWAPCVQQLRPSLDAERCNKLILLQIQARPTHTKPLLPCVHRHPPLQKVDHLLMRIKARSFWCARHGHVPEGKDQRGRRVRSQRSGLRVRSQRKRKCRWALGGEVGRAPVQAPIQPHYHRMASPVTDKLHRAPAATPNLRILLTADTQPVACAYRHL